MTKRRPSLMEFMRQQNLLQSPTQVPLETLRKQIEESVFVRNLEQTARAINKAAGSLLVDTQSYLWPEPLIRTFGVQKNREEHVMQLVLTNGQLVLAFLSHRPRGTVLSRYLPWVFAHWLGLHEVDVIVKCSGAVAAEAVTTGQIESWFVYLLSGLDGSLAPVIASAQPEGKSAAASELSLGSLDRRKTLAMEKVS
jgi:hypothetical protein